MSKEIPLTRGHVAIVDDEDYEWLSQWKWTAFQSGNQVYAYRKHKNKSVLLHRLITSAPKGKVVDHINRNGLDNRRENLRVVGRKENALNSSFIPNGTSKYRGVRYSKNAWQSEIMVDRKYIYLGRFKSEEDAARAYDAAATMYFKSDARLNLPETE